jgi:prepilin-type N-terminal cleavage/methylation domain-containing protein
MRLRGASLIEMLIVVSLLGIVAALATPAMRPTVAHFRVYSSTTAVAAFIDDARRRAVAEGRCVRVRQVGNALVAERRNASDCVNLTFEGWTGVESQLRLDGPVTMTLEALTTPGGVTAADHLVVFRPNGRLYGDGDRDITDDGARVRVGEIQSFDTRAVIVTPAGRICLKNYGATAPVITAAGAVSCQ